MARFRLWVQLALLAALGVVVMHAVHLVIGSRVAGRALAMEQENLGRRMARLVAEQAVDPLLVNDVVTLHELVSSAAGEGGRATYCFLERGGVVVASSQPASAMAPLLAVRPERDFSPLIVRWGNDRVLDLAAPVLGGDLGVVRLGLDLGGLQATRRRLATDLGLLAVAVISGGLLAAFFVGRSVARPLAEILEAADRFDPAAGGEVPAVRPGGSREIAVLGERFDRMMRRLRVAHVEQAQAREKGIETERLVALGSLVAGVAHEVNNPLAGLKNCLRRLERGDLPEGKRLEYLALMEEGLQRIEEVVQQLLDFGRPHPPRFEPVRIERLVRESAALVESLLAQKRVQARILDLEGSGAVLVDRRLIEQALVNLLLNAAYVSAEGGEIRIRQRIADGRVGIAVEDDGPGIPEEIRERILDPFFSTKPEGEGTGLGLSVTRTIIDAHGGELTFEFPQAGGTVATVWVRPAPAAPAA